MEGHEHHHIPLSEAYMLYASAFIDQNLNFCCLGGV